MPSGQNTGGDELDLEVITEDESAEDTQYIQEDEGESEELNLETEEAQVDKLSPAEENARKQEEAWLNKVISGNAAVEDAPKWLQGRLNKRLDAVEKAPDTEEVVRKVLEKEREDAEFQERKSQIPKLTPAQAKEFTERYNQLRPAGKLAALNTVIELMGLSQKMREAEQRGIAKGRMSLPRSGQPAVRKSDQVVGGVPMDVIQDDKKWNEMIRTGTA